MLVTSDLFFLMYHLAVKEPLLSKDLKFVFMSYLSGYYCISWKTDARSFLNTVYKVVNETRLQCNSFVNHKHEERV